MSSSTPPSLLLLPAPPTTLTPATWKAAYLPSIAGALQAIHDLKKSSPTMLEIVVACPKLQGRLEEPRSQIFHDVEQILAGLYSLVCFVCVEHSIDSDGPGGIDPRIILATYDSSHEVSNDSNPKSLATNAAGPIVELHTFALTRRHWEHIFSSDGEEGGRFFSRFMNIVRLVPFSFTGEFHIVSGGISMTSGDAGDTAVLESLAIIHRAVAVGGTFDHLHPGHKLLLTATALLLQPANPGDLFPRRLIVGITGDQLLKNKKFAEQMQSWEQRQDEVVKFLLSILYYTKDGQGDISTASFNEPVVNGRAIHTHLKQAGITIECVEIQDPFGPTITDESISALVVSGETRSGGALVNEKRQEKAWKPLEVFEVNVLDSDFDDNPSVSDNFASKISSTAIRKRISEVVNGS